MRLLYDDLIENLLEVQISLRTNYLKKFIDGFSKIDKDEDGVLTQEEFRRLIQAFKIYKDEKTEQEETENLIDQLDPYNTDNIIISDIVDLLSNQFIKGTNVLIMDRIAEYDVAK